MSLPDDNYSIVAFDHQVTQIEHEAFSPCGTAEEPEIFLAKRLPAFPEGFNVANTMDKLSATAHRSDG